MTSHVLSLPSDTWYEIAELLEVRDINNLRKVNKQLHELFSSNRVWKPLSQLRWFSIDDQSIEILKEVDNFCLYYKERAKCDRAIRFNLNNMTRSDDPRKIFELGWEITRMNYKAVPFLQNLKKTLQEGMNRENSLSLRYYSQMLLMSIRHSEVLKVVKEICQQFLRPVEDIEETLFKLSYLDPSFDNLLPFRRKVIEETIEKVQTHPKFDESEPPSVKVLLIRNALLEVIKRTSHITDKICLEDHFILRVYAGETNGKKIILEAIIQKIASYFDIECKLTESFLIVKDSSYNTGFAYILLTAQRAKIFTYSHILRTLHLPEVHLNKLLAPITGRQLLWEILEGASEQRLSFFADIDDYKLIYPYSKSSIKPKYLNFLSNFVHSTLPHYDLTGELAENMPSGELIDEMLIKDLSRELPFDLPHFLTPQYREQINPSKTSERIFNEFFKFEYLSLSFEDRENLSEDCDKPSLLIGQIVCHSRTNEYGVVIGHKTTKWAEYYVIYDRYGEMRTCDCATLKPVDQINQDILNKLTIENWIGLLFGYFDHSKNRFIPTSHLLKLYPNL